MYAHVFMYWYNYITSNEISKHTHTHTHTPPPPPPPPPSPPPPPTTTTTTTTTTATTCYSPVTKTWQLSGVQIVCTSDQLCWISRAALQQTEENKTSKQLHAQNKRSDRSHFF